MASRWFFTMELVDGVPTSSRTVEEEPLAFED